MNNPIRTIDVTTTRGVYFIITRSVPWLAWDDVKYSSLMIAENIRDTLSYCYAYLNEDMTALPKLHIASEEESKALDERGRRVSIQCAGDQFIGDLRCNAGSGWVDPPVGDKLFVHGLEDTLSFCEDFLMQAFVDAEVL